MPVRPRVHVLLEGPSDVAAVEEVLLARAPAGPAEARGAAYRLIDMGGVTNTDARLREAAALDPPPRVVGLCDAGEARVVVRALQRRGVGLGGPEDLAAHGFFVCERDLEDELIRALGLEACVALLERLGLGPRFRAFSGQRVWAGRPLADRLHRFAGVAAGRKVRLAQAMARELGPDRVPPPISALVEQLEPCGRMGS